MNKSKYHSQSILSFLLIAILFTYSVLFAKKDIEQSASSATEIDIPISQSLEVTEKAKQVYFHVYVIDIDSIDSANQNFKANLYLYMYWKDERLAHQNNTHIVPLDEIWNPHLIVVNRAGLIKKTLPEVAEIERDGTVIYRQRYNGPFSQHLNLSQFPFDQHDFTIEFTAPGFSSDELDFLPGNLGGIEGPIAGGSISDELSLQDWNILRIQTQKEAYEPIKDIKMAGFTFTFTAKRSVLYYIWQVIIPLIFIVLMSWGAFYIDPTNAGAQIGIATSSMLTLIAYRFMLGNLVPNLPYMTRLDYFLFGSTTLVFLTLIEVFTTTSLALNEKETFARKIDHWCRWIFPVAFIIWSLWSFAL